MQTIHSRTYTNVALTVLIILLLAVLVRPYVGLPKAQAASGDFSDGSTRTLNPYGEASAALREIAKSNQEIASAVRETAKAQREVAESIHGLGVGTVGSK
jgi:hypothetical protein